MAFDMQNYIDVKTRIKQFREKYPEGSLQPLNHEKPYDIITMGNDTFIIYTACAYRNPNDPRPGIGTAMERFPGRTNYTKDSELMNAETSAWGRAIVAALAVDTDNGVASYEEVRNRQASDTPSQPARVTTAPQNGNKKTENTAPKSAPKRVAEAPLKNNGVISEAQVAFIGKLQTRVGISDADLMTLAGKDVPALTTGEASALINDLLAVSKDNAQFEFGDDGQIKVVHNG